MADLLYDSLEWQLARKLALARDGHRCTVSRLLGGRCSPTLHVHHLVPVAEGGAPLEQDNLVTACARHHPKLHALRRAILEGRAEAGPPRCPHRHRTAEARELCERAMARRRERGRQLELV